MVGWVVQLNLSAGKAPEELWQWWTSCFGTGSFSRRLTTYELSTLSVRELLLLAVSQRDLQRVGTRDATISCILLVRNRSWQARKQAFPMNSLWAPSEKRRMYSLKTRCLYSPENLRGLSCWDRRKNPFLLGVLLFLLLSLQAVVDTRAGSLQQPVLQVGILLSAEEVSTWCIFSWKRGLGGGGFKMFAMWDDCVWEIVFIGLFKFFPSFRI